MVFESEPITFACYSVSVVFFSLAKYNDIIRDGALPITAIGTKFFFYEKREARGQK